ncbi:MAG: hypothetical protein P8Y61_04805 [Gammaproteobacteria bacterium]
MQPKQLSLNSSLALRAAGLVAVVAAGLASVIGSGGGGGGGGTAPPPADYLEITSVNALEIAGVVVDSVYTSLELAEAGDLAEGGAGATALVLDSGVLQPLRRESLDVGIQEVIELPPEDCLVTGTVTLSADLSDPFTISVGDRITAVFANCDDGDGAVTDGRLQLIIRAIAGDPLTDVFLLRTDVSLTSFAITEDGETTSADGSFELTLDSLDYPVVFTRLLGDSLTGTADGDTRTLINFDETVETNLGDLPYPSVVTAFGTLASRVLEGRVDFDTPVPVAGPAGDAPDTGEILITGLDGATIRIVVLGQSSVELRLDFDGNGSVDEVQPTTWAELGGSVAPGVTEANAAALAGEAIAAAVSFQEAVRDAGAQFTTDGAFWNALSGISVPGSFGPISPRCVLSNGSASVSGELAVPGTFTAGDVFNGSFVNCFQQTQFPFSIIVNGNLDIVVTDYVGFGGFFTVGFDAVANQFQGVDAALTATYSLPDNATILSYSGSSPVVQLTGARARALYGAEVTGEYNSFVSPTRLTRTVSGDLYTALIPGRYELSTPVPLIIFSVGGPCSGALLLTAENGTSVRIVPIGPVNDDPATCTSAQLELDLDGNGSTDRIIEVLWQDLLQLGSA